MLDYHHRTAIFLGIASRECGIGGISLIKPPGAGLTRVDHDDWRSRSFPVFRAVPKPLLEGAQVGVAVVEELVEGAPSVEAFFDYVPLAYA